MFTLEQIEAIKEKIGGETYLIKWMREISTCKRCGRVDDHLTLKLCDSCRDDSRN